MRRLRAGPILLALLAACCSGESTPIERVTIPPGTSLSQVADSLAAHQVIESRRWFRTLARLRGVERSVKAGVYEFRRGSGAWRALSALNRGAVVAIRFTVPEGLTIWDLADATEEQLGIPSDSRAGRRHRYRPGPHPRHSRREPRGLPAAGDLPGAGGVSSRELVVMMVREFLRQWQPAWDHRLDTLHVSRRALLSLAAIVEAESRHEDERAMVAGVYWNRLRLGMPLQADPTVQYAIEARTGERKPRLYYKDLAIASPYNTYLHPGLPPGPINSPGISSIRAALYPDSRAVPVFRRRDGRPPHLQPHAGRARPCGRPGPPAADAEDERAATQALSASCPRSERPLQRFSI